MAEAHGSEEYAVIEAFPPEEYRFFTRYHIMASFYAVFFLGLVFVVWVPFLMEACSGGVADPSVVRAAAAITAAFALLAVLGGLGKREFDRTRFIVSHERIVRSDAYRTVSIAWRDIVTVRNRKFPGAKRALELTASGARILLPSTIAGFGRLCAGVRRGLEQAGRGTLMDSVQLRAMAAAGDMAERWNRRAKNAFWPLSAATVGVLLFNAFVASRVWGTGTLSLVVWAGIGLPLPLLVYAVADIRCNRTFEKALLSGSGNAYKEDLVTELIIGFLVVAPFYGILGIIARTIFLR
jgi:hypothetical protein